MSSPSPAVVLPLSPEWLAFLGSMEQSLAQALAGLPETAPLAESTSPAEASRAAGLVEALAALDRRLEGLDGCIRQAEERVGELEALCAGALEAANQWQARAAAARQRLAEAIGRAV